MKHLLPFLLVTCLSLIPDYHARASTLDTLTASTELSVLKEAAAHPSFKLKKPSLFQQFRAIKALKKEFRARKQDGEKISTLAWVALGVFTLSLIMGFFVSSLPGLLWPVAILFLASNGLAIAALIKDDNRKSRILAWTILITSMFLAILAVIAYVLLLALFIALF